MAAGCGRLDFDGHDGPETPQSTLTLDFGGQLTLTEQLTDLPVLVVLDDARARRDLLRADAADLRFFGADGQLLAHELEQVGAIGGAPLLAWVVVPRPAIGAVTQLTVAYGGDPNAPRAPGPVWSDAFAAVWHFDEASGAPARDATGAGHHGTLRGTRQIAGAIGLARGFTATRSDAIVIDDASDLTFSTFTLSTWSYYASSPGGLYFALISRQLEREGANELFLSNFASSANAEIATADGSFVSTGGTLPMATWKHVAAVYDGFSLKLYVDGQVVFSRAASGRPARPISNPIFLGADRNANVTAPGIPDTDFLDGALDEVRVERVARSAQWLQASYLIMQDRALHYGPVKLVR